MNQLYVNQLFFKIVFVSLLIFSTRVYAQLPVELTKFEAKYENEKVVIEWETASEINNNKFQIERSSNGKDYEVVYEKMIPEAEANSTIVKQYKTEDLVPLNGNSFYRLKQIDLNGTFEIFDAVAVNCKMASGFYFNSLLFNNKDKSILMNIHSDDKENVECKIISYSGQIILETDLACLEGLNQFKINDFFNNKGIYLIYLKSKKQTIVSRLLMM